MKNFTIAIRKIRFGERRPTEKSRVAKQNYTALYLFAL